MTSARHNQWNSMVFMVPHDATAQIRPWQQSVNHHLIAGHLARTGEADVTRLGQQGGWMTITELPALGEAEPYVGDFGGLYTFTFSPSTRGCDLQVTAAPAAFKWASTDALAPLDIQLPPEVVVLTTRVPRCALDWSGPELNQDEDRSFVHEISLDELEFPIDGTMYVRLVAWGWDSAQVEAYRYRFIPLSVGCEMVVEHRPSGRHIHLTEDVCW